MHHYWSNKQRFLLGYFTRRSVDYTDVYVSVFAVKANSFLWVSKKTFESITNPPRDMDSIEYVASQMRSLLRPLMLRYVPSVRN